MESYCHSVIIGKDIVPRLSLRTFEKLRDDAVEGLFFCKLNKQQIMWDVLCCRCCCFPQRQFLYQQGEVPEDILKNLQSYRESVSQSEQIDASIEKSREFLPPGKLLFFRPFKNVSQKKNKKKRNYDVVYISAEELLKEGILISPRMFHDHLPDVSTTIIQTTTQQIQEANQGDNYNIIAQMV
eukprot:TRINITY_DN18855_c0_g1_i2.p1 TRINITY_DN18855_c0_g1~~TRINITY_DN18855_c0_g1_i2.p1  ORF type:complete len:183 (-),score=20.94 TRINITY_DN18855_c0_g1_i2:444-992(-)